MHRTTGPLRVELYVRSLAADPAPRHERAVADLAALSDRGVLDEYTVRVWGKELPADGDHPLTDRVDTFREWAVERGVDIVGMGERKRGTLVDERRSVVTLPTLALAEYREGDLACVTPYRCGDRVVSVRDRLDAMEPGDHDTAAATLASD